MRPGVSPCALPMPIIVGRQRNVGPCGEDRFGRQFQADDGIVAPEAARQIDGQNLEATRCQALDDLKQFHPARTTPARRATPMLAMLYGY